MGFSREGHDFDYDVPGNTWMHIVITGSGKGTCLYVNGKLQKKMYDDWMQFVGKDKTKMRKVETQVFPLQTIGSFKEKIDALQIWNKVLSDKEIEDLK